MNNKIKVIKVEDQNIINRQNITVVEIENDLDSYYKHINCECIDMVELMPADSNGIWYTMICDDEGILNDRPITIILEDRGIQLIHGTVLIAKTDEEGCTIGLSDEDVQLLLDLNIYYDETLEG